MPDAHSNFANSTVAAAPTPAISGTSLDVRTGDAQFFPVPPFNASVIAAGISHPTPGQAEIVRVTNVGTDTFTITRAQEGSNARSIQAGDRIVASITAKAITDVEGSLVLKAPLANPALTGNGTAGTIADTATAAGASWAMQNAVVSDSVHQVASATQVREGTALDIKFDHNLDYTEGTVGGFDLGPATSLSLRPANWSAFHKTHITSGSNGYNVTAPAGWTVPGVLNVTSTTNFDAAGSLRITMGGAIGGTVAVLNYTSVTANTFVGCTFVSGTGTIATGATVQKGATGTDKFPRGYVTLEGTTTFTHQAALIGDAVDYISLRVTKNPTGVANNIGGKNVFLNNNSYIADGATINAVPSGYGGFYPSLNTFGNLGFEDQPIYSVDATNGGQLNNICDVSFYSGPIHLEHTHAKWRCGFYVDDADVLTNSFGDGLGVVDLAVGFQCNELVTAATNIAINVGNPDTSVSPLFRVAGGLTNSGSGNYTQASIAGALTMNASGGAGGTGNSWTGFSNTATVSYAQAGHIIASTGFSHAGIYKNTSTSGTLALGALYSYYAAPTIEADTATVTASIYTGFLSAPSTARLVSGGLTIGALTAVDSTLTVGANTTVTTRVGYHVTDAVNNGVLTNQYGVDIDALSAGASVNVGLRNKSSSQFGSSAQLTISNAGALVTSGTSTLTGGVYGDSASGGNLVLNSTSHATKGYVNLVDEVRHRPLDQTFTAIPAWLGWLNTYTLNFASANLNPFVNMAPTVIFQQSGGAFGSAVNVSASPTYKNLSSVAANFGLITSYLSNPTVTADTQTGLTGSVTSYSSSPITSVASAGSMTLAAITHYSASAAIGASTTITAMSGLTAGAAVAGTVTTLTGVSIANATGAGTVTTQIGVDIASLTKGGTTNIGIRNKSSSQFGSSAQLTIDTSGNFATSGTAATGALTVTGAATVSGNIGFNGKTAQALTSFSAPTATLSRAALANPTYTTTGGTGATAGAFDTAAHRDNVITDLFTVTKTLAALITDLRANGVIG